MKNYFNIYILLISSIFILFSCEDNDINIEDQNTTKNAIELISYGNNKTSSGNSLLHFSDIEIFTETVKNLEKKYIEHDDAFLAQYG